MEIKLKKIKNKHKSVLANMFQLYMHDITAFLPMEINEHGLFVYDHLDSYFADETKLAYFVRVDDEYAGFVLVNQNPEVLPKSQNTFVIDEMFILNAYKNKGIGSKVAKQIFAMHAGDWEVKPVPRNESAKRFWQKVVKEFSNGDFNETETKPGRVYFTFQSKGELEEITLKAGCFLIDAKSKKVGLIYREKWNDFSFPKGHLEKGENLKECAIRETAEETKRQAEIVDSIEPACVKYKISNGEVCKVYLYVAFDKGPSNNTSEDAHDFEFVDFEMVEEKLTHENGKQAWREVKEKIKELIK